MSDGNAFERDVAARLRAGADVMRRTADTCAPDISRAAVLLAACFRNGGRLLLCGNGGSAADCQHIASEFTSVLDRRFVRPPLPALALTTDTSFLTASANDFGFDGVFARQVEAMGRRGDVLVAISTSGKSTNVVLAAGKARALGLATIALTGAFGGALGDITDVAIRIPSDDVQHIQEAHTAVGHIICFLTERMVFSEPRT